MADPNNPWPFPTADSHEKSPEAARPVVIEPSEDALDAGVEESFPASDPVSVTVSKVIEKHEKKPTEDTS